MLVVTTPTSRTIPSEDLLLTKVLVFPGKTGSQRSEGALCVLIVGPGSQSPCLLCSVLHAMLLEARAAPGPTKLLRKPHSPVSLPTGHGHLLAWGLGLQAFLQQPGGREN